MRAGWGALAIVAALAACGDNRVDVDLRVRMESADGIALGESPLAWLVEFDTWVATIDTLQLADEDGDVVGGNGGNNLIVMFTDHPTAHVATTFLAPRGEFSVNFGSEVPQIGQPRADTSVTDGIVLTMNDNDWTHLITGRAIGPQQPDGSIPIVGLELGFGLPVRRLDCGDGVEVADDGDSLTVSLVPQAPFWTTLGDDGEASFEAFWAADRDRDDRITNDELRAQASPDPAVGTLYQLARQNLARSLRLGAAGDCDTRT